MAEVLIVDLDGVHNVLLLIQLTSATKTDSLS